MVAHGYDLRAEIANDSLVAALQRDYRKAELSPADRALCDFAVKLTNAPGEIAEGDVDAVRGAGFSDRAISDAVQVVAYFNYINRVADGLGVDLEQGMPPRADRKA